MKVHGRYEFYYKFILRNNETGFRYYEEDTGGYEKVLDGWIESKEIFKATPHALSKRYGATHLLINKKYEAGLSKVWGGELDLFHRPVFENATYAVCTDPAEVAVTYYISQTGGYYSGSMKGICILAEQVCSRR